MYFDYAKCAPINHIYVELSIFSIHLQLYLDHENDFHITVFYIQDPACTYSTKTVATSLPYAAPQSKHGTNSPLGTLEPYVQQARRKKNITNNAKERILNLPIKTNV